MTNFHPHLHAHRRINPLTGRAVLVSPQRNLRPWQGQQEAADSHQPPSHDPTCYLCAGNARVGGKRNPDYHGPYVFDNDFAALQVQAPAPTAAHPLLQSLQAQGVARVLCFSEHHALSLPELPLPSIERVVDAWSTQTSQLGERWRWVQVFENKGASMGCSNPHPHGQIWASDFIPDEPAQEDSHQRSYWECHGHPLLIDYAELEVRLGDRVVEQTPHWLAVVPFWAAWPFETLVLPRVPLARLSDLTPVLRGELAQLLKALTTRYDNLFQCSFPYSMGWHGAPHDARDTAAWQVHAHFYPPLLRSATVRKFMVGFEMLGEPQRDLTPEQAAAALRATSTVHFKEQAHSA